MSKMPPREFVLLHAPFVEAFGRVARGLGFSGREANDWLAQIPAAIAGVDAWYDRVSNLWRYCFGDEITINGAMGFGPHTWPQMGWVVQAARIISCHMPPEARARFTLQSFGLSLKHADALAECRPLWNLSSGASATYETDGDGPKRVDWTITSDNGTRVLLEVKRRAKPLYAFLETIVPTMAQAQHSFTFDTDSLFKDTETKFPVAPRDDALQGLWIEKGVNLEIRDILDSFGRLNPLRVRFALFPDDARGASLFCREGVSSSTLAAILGVRIAETYCV